MTKKARKSADRQPQTHLEDAVAPVPRGLPAQLTEAISTRDHLLQWVIGCGLEALGEEMRLEAEAIAGPKGKRIPDRTHNHWGTAQAEFPLGGRKISMPRPRIRRVNGREEPLRTVTDFQNEDALPERVLEQILVGVSTRGYARSLGEEPNCVETRGTSKSAASRNLIKRTAEKMDAYLSRPLNEYHFVALMVDGIEIAERSVVVGLGITSSGDKVPLGIWSGSTENSSICTALLNDLLDRGLKVEGKLLCVIDGGKGIRKSLSDVFGNRAIVQRCQLHKRRNLKGHLPRGKQVYVDKQLNEAYRATNHATAKAKLDALHKWLISNGEEDAARSLKEGMEETLTVLKLGLQGSLLRSFSTTNAIENLMGTIRRVTRNVKRWRDGVMIRRWVAMAIEEAEANFRKIKGHRELNKLIEAISKLDGSEQAA